MQLETERLILRHPEVRDSEEYFSFCNSEFVMRYNAMQYSSLEQIQKRFSDSEQNRNTFLMEHRQTGEVIGAIFIEEDSLRWGVPSKELSYFLRESCSRQGYMKEALRAVIKNLFQTEPLLCVAARSFAPNTASRRLLESLGFHQDGYIPKCVKGYRDIIFDDTLCSLSRECFEANEKVP